MIRITLPPAQVKLIGESVVLRSFTMIHTE